MTHRRLLRRRCALALRGKGRLRRRLRRRQPGRLPHQPGLPLRQRHLAPALSHLSYLSHLSHVGRALSLW
eukprot:5635917-Pyramimonas_sp.AAC.1